MIKIGAKKVGKGNPCFIIAEAGVNHNGSLKRALQMVGAAKEAGADAIKFQTFRTKELVTFYASKADYQRKRSVGRTQFDMLKGLELSESDFVALKKHCAKKKIIFLSTPFDAGSARFLQRIGIPAFKIGSGDLTNLPFLSEIAKFRKPILLSTGMSDLREINEAVKAIHKAGNRKLMLLHCTSNYPTEFKDVNLTAIDTLRSKFKMPVGYSDHTLGWEVSVAVVALGACVIEKHFTLDKSLPGPDQEASLGPNELKTLVKAVRNIEEARGNGKKQPVSSERDVRITSRKSIVAAIPLRKGTKLTLSMLKIKRPGGGLSPSYLSKLIGKRIKSNINKDGLLTRRSV